MVIHKNFLPYVRSLEKRLPGKIELVVIHCTELPDLATARDYGLRTLYLESGTGNSGHYYVDRCGRIERWVPVERIAHHVRGFNKRSIGIELVNRGRYPDWLNSNAQEMKESYPPEQIDGLVYLLQFLCNMYAGLKWIAGHEQLDTVKVSASDCPELQVFRKRDPGPQFPWEHVLQSTRLKTYL